MRRDGFCKSIWQTVVRETNQTAEVKDQEYEVAVIGAGITGVSTALLLQQAGKSCILIEAQNPGFGTTGGTTAHLNTFFDTPYYQISKDFGEVNAQLIAEGALAAIAQIKRNIAESNIDCDFTERDAYLFALDKKQSEDLERIVESANQRGIKMDFTDDTPFPISHVRAAKIPSQAHFNPMLYLYGMLKEYRRTGGSLVENCRLMKLEEGDLLTLTTTMGTVKARNLVYATHIPPGVNLLHSRCAPYRSYAMAVKLKGDEYPAAMGYDMNDPYHYYRTQQIAGEKFLIVGGEDHKTGHEENTDACFRRLEGHINETFPVEKLAFQWSSQYFEPNDGLPYIGKLPGCGKNVLVATGFGGNGMIYGSLAALIICDLLVSGSSIYQQLLDPGRVKPIAGFSNFVKEGADVVKNLIKGIIPADKLKQLADMAPGEAIVAKFDGKVLGLYKDDQGAFHAVSPACTHIKCTVGWNTAEKSWDCPCHGSRYSYDGELLCAPAQTDLQRIDLVMTGKDSEG